MERAESDCEGERRRLTSSDYTTIFLAVLGKSFDVKPKGWVDWSTALGFFSSYSIIRGPCVKRACRSTKEETSKLLPSLGLFPIRNVRMLRSRDFEVDPLTRSMPRRLHSWLYSDGTSWPHPYFSSLNEYFFFYFNSFKSCVFRSGTEATILFKDIRTLMIRQFTNIYNQNPSCRESKNPADQLHELKCTKGYYFQKQSTSQRFLTEILTIFQRASSHPETLLGSNFRLKYNPTIIVIRSSSKCREREINRYVKNRRVSGSIGVHHIVSVSFRKFHETPVTVSRNHS